MKYPMIMLLHLTEKCNLSCKHCYASAGGTASLEVDRVKEILQDFSNKGGSICILSGGEPLLYPCLLEVIRMAKKENLLTYITTNGTLLSQIKDRDKIIKEIDGIQVSFESSIPNQHDRIRGKGTFNLLLQNLEKLPKKILREKLNIMITLFSFNANAIDQHIKWFVDKFGSFCSIERFVAMGRGTQISLLTPSQDQCKDAFTRILFLKRSSRYGNKIHCSDPLFWAILYLNGELEEWGYEGGCAAGKSVVSITPQGTITPCSRLYIDVGSLEERSLWDIWKNSKVLKDLRNRDKLKGKCGKCKLRHICGGCRAAAYAHSGDYLGEDPGCWL